MLVHGVIEGQTKLPNSFLSFNRRSDVCQNLRDDGVASGRDQVRLVSQVAVDGPQPCVEMSGQSPERQGAFPRAVQQDDCRFDDACAGQGVNAPLSNNR